MVINGFFIALRAAATQIVENIQAKVWTASAVLEAYLARAVQAQQATNCLTEGMFAPDLLYVLTFNASALALFDVDSIL